MRIAFIHNNAKTGATVHAMMLAQKLQEKMEVAFLAQELSGNGVDFSGVREVLLFENTLEEKSRFRLKWPLHVSIVVRIRYCLYHVHLLKLADKIGFFWKPFRYLERKWYQRRMPLPGGLENYLKEHDREYDAYIVMGNYNSIPYHVLKTYSKKVILIPLVHLERSQFMMSAHDIMNETHFFAYNTHAEKKLAERIHGECDAFATVVGCGVELLPSSAGEWSAFKREKNIAGEYLLYVGRVTRKKAGKLFSYFTRYKQRHNCELQLLIAGDNYLSGEIVDKDIVYLGFVEDVIKSELIRHATAVVNPSFVESLSLIVLEAMAAGVPVLVNGRCEVLRQHCERSGGGVYYLNYNTFERELARLISDPSGRKQMGEKGRVYERENYSWEVITRKWEKIIQEVNERNKQGCG